MLDAVMHSATHSSGLAGKVNSYPRAPLPFIAKAHRLSSTYTRSREREMNMAHASVARSGGLAVCDAPAHRPSLDGERVAASSSRVVLRPRPQARRSVVCL